MRTDDLLAHIEDDIRTGELDIVSMKKAQTERIDTPKLSIRSIAINIDCPCGGGCVDSRGSLLIEDDCIIAKCELCDACYVVPSTLFRPIERTAVPAVPENLAL